jgi:hypothetical protein
LTGNTDIPAIQIPTPIRQLACPSPRSPFGVKPFMTLSEERAKFLAAALYEMRVLLQVYRGDDEYVVLAERLAYALHNDALSVIEGNADFDVAASRQRIAIFQKIVGSPYPDNFGLLLEEPQ